ncbi:MAG TPA: ATP-dependent RNA helicase HrpA, partial [Propionibacteriaceae bacterium]|nr:ATP-dependent RNA helicase HrpA [Propionibacteriaceae bacterium]
MTVPATQLPDGVRIEFDPTLPIAAHADELAELIAAHQVIVVAGATGSGKTTQLPKICLRLGRRRIAHTQPRRIAARTVAERIAEEMAVEIGGVVGYQVRFTRRATRQTRVKVMTDGVLLAEIGHDRDLRAYDTIIIDEAHERSLNIDFLLGYLKQLLPRRPELKVIVTSATIDTARFSAHFNDAPVIEVSGRTYPVDVRYAPLGEEDASDLMDGLTAAVEELVAEGPGDILCFLSGEREIRDAAEAVTALGLPNTEVLPLYARLSAAEQHRVFERHSARRIVLATNVAETSLTVPGIRYVIDPGTARISRYSARTKVQRLPIEAISQASANQRAGRCGREAPGICIRLYSEDDFDSRPEFTEPEILRTNLASVILQMTQAGLGEIARFGFVEPPDASQVTDGMRLLDELGAIKPGNQHKPRLTPVGHKLARIPVDPRLGRMLVAAEELGCLREVQVIVAGLAIPDVRERPAEHREQADAMHRRFWTDAPITPAAPNLDDQGAPLRHTAHTGTRVEKVEAGAGGDVLAIWRLWEHLRTLRGDLSGNAFRRMCRSEYLNFLRVREWEDLHAQLREICRELSMERNSVPASSDAVLTAVLAGLLSHVGLADLREAKSTAPGAKRRRPGPREYLGARGARFAINPGSALAKTQPPLVMAVELVETTRLWARTVAEIKAEWVEQVGAHLLRRSYSEPHWSTSSGAVIAFEKVQLYGVPIVADRLVSYARIDPVVAREIFIRSALVEGAWQSRHEFLAHNASMRTLAEDLEERSRRRDIVVDDDVIFDFYNKRIPDEVVSASHFDAWWRRTSDKQLLDLSMDDLVNDEGESVSARDFPDRWRTGTLDLAVTYVFDPGAGHDGVSVQIPLTVLNQVSPEPFSWQVPGLRQELATELVRGLPKSVRTNFVPAPNFARDALIWLASNDEDHAQPFCLELGRALRAMTGVVIEPADWQPEAVPGHLRVTFAVTERGVETRRSKEFSEL